MYAKKETYVTNISSTINHTFSTNTPLKKEPIITDIAVIFKIKVITLKKPYNAT